MGITFLYPGFLWGLLLVAIPIIIHLFNFKKYKTVYFSNVELLKDVEQESKKTRNVKNWIILLLRCLAVIALVLTFAYPVQTSQNKSGRNYVSIYLDNSFSMDMEGVEGNKFNLSKSFADQIIKGFDDNTKFQILTNDFSPQHQFYYNKEKALNLVSEVPISSASRKFNHILQRQLSLVTEQENALPSIYWISDFQALSDSVFFNPDSVPVNLCLLESGTSQNISVDSVWFDSPIRSKFGNEELNVRIRNYGKDDHTTLPVTLTINGQQTLQTVEIKGESSKEFSFSFQQPNDSVAKGMVSIEDPILPFDNHKLFSYTLQQKTNVLIISSESEFNKTAQKIFKGDSSIQVVYNSENNINLSAIAQQDLIVLGEVQNISSGLVSTLEKAQEKGASIAVFPAKNTVINNYNTLTQRLANIQITKIDTNATTLESINQVHPFFKRVFKEQEVSENLKKSLPKLYTHLKTKGNGEVLIHKEDGNPFLMKEGDFYLVSSGVSTKCSNLKSHALVVPLFYQLVFNASKRSQVQYELGGIIELPSSKNLNSKSVEIIHENNGKYLASVQPVTKKILLPGSISQTGNYQVFSNGELKDAFSLNYNREESKEISNQIGRLNYLETNDENFKLFLANEGNAKQIIELSQNQRPYWKMALITAIVCLLLEMLIIRLFGR